jgi:hypothetical protein
MMYDYSDEKPKAGDNILAQLAGLAQEQKRAEAEVAAAEEALQKAKDRLNHIRLKELPELCAIAQMDKFTTVDGLVVDVSEEVRASIPKQNNADAIAWLEKNGHAALVKRSFTIEFGKEEETWANKFESDLKKRKKPLRVKRKQDVHPQTLGAFVREQMAEGVPVPMDLLGVFRQRVANVTLPKEKTSKGKKGDDLF